MFPTGVQEHRRLPLVIAVEVCAPVRAISFSSLPWIPVVAVAIVLWVLVMATETIPSSLWVLAVRRPLPKQWLGRFFASDFTETIEIQAVGGAHAYLAAYSLQSVAKFVPEPSTVGMLGLGLGLIAVSRRKLHKYND